MADPTTPNPYTAPQAPIGIPADPSSLPLASPWHRLAAAIVDGIILAPIGYVLGKIFFHTPTPEEAAKAIEKYGSVDAAIKALSPGIPMLLLIHFISLAIFVGVNFVFLKKGQTIGKMALKLQIQDRTTGALLPLQDLIIKRVLPVYILNALSFSIHQAIGIILLVDALCIFRPGRNTLHDDLANSKVVKLPG